MWGLKTGRQFVSLDGSLPRLRNEFGYTLRCPKTKNLSTMTMSRSPLSSFRSVQTRGVSTYDDDDDTLSPRSSDTWNVDGRKR